MSADNLVKVPKPRLAEWLMEPMRRNRDTYWKVAVAAVFINIFGLLTALFTMTVYDRVVPNNATASLIALRAFPRISTLAPKMAGLSSWSFSSRNRTSMPSGWAVSPIALPLPSS